MTWSRAQKPFQVLKYDPAWHEQLEREAEEELQKEETRHLGVMAVREDRRTWYPAARCKECGVITWEVSLARGRRRVEAPQHGSECAQPLGRLDLEKRRREVGL